jgi:sulfur carrier protein
MTPQPHQIFVNGEARTVHAPTIASLIDELGIPGATLLIEHNGNALRRDEWPAQTLAEGDRVELLRIAAGG